jgi:hypothetical protein
MYHPQLRVTRVAGSRANGLHAIKAEASATDKATDERLVAQSAHTIDGAGHLRGVYLLAFVIYAGVLAAATHKRIRTFKAISAGMLSPLD